MKKLGKKWLIIPAILYGLNSCGYEGKLQDEQQYKCQRPDKAVVLTVSEENQIDEVIEKVYSYLDLEKEGTKVENTEQYLKDIGNLVSFMIYEELGIDFSGVQINYFESEEKYCETFSSKSSSYSRPCPEGFIDECNQIFINPYLDSLVQTLEGIMHEMGHYASREIYGANNGEKISLFFENYLYLAGYVTFAPRTEEGKFKHVFHLDDWTWYGGLLNDLRSITRQINLEDFLEVDNWQKLYMIAHYGLFRGLYETGGDFLKTLDWLIKTSDEEIKEKYKESLENKTLCQELETAVSYLEDFLLSNTNGGYIFEGVNLTKEYIEAFYQEIEDCKKLENNS